MRSRAQVQLCAAVFLALVGGYFLLVRPVGTGIQRGPGGKPWRCPAALSYIVGDAGDGAKLTPQELRRRYRSDLAKWRNEGAPDFDVDGAPSKPMWSEYAAHYRQTQLCARNWTGTNLMLGWIGVLAVAGAGSLYWLWRVQHV